MTTRNFRVNNGISVGDIVISASTNTITGLTTSAPSADGDVANKKYVDDSVSALSSNSITQGNSNVTVTDAGTGSITVSADGTTRLTVAAAGVTVANALTASDTLGVTGATTLSSTLNVTGVADLASDLRVRGNLTVDGEQLIVNTTVLSVEDNIIELNRNASGNAGMPTFTGLKINRGETSTATEQDLFWVWDDSFSEDGSTYGTANAGGAWTALRATTDNDSGPSTISSQESSLVDIRCRIIRAVATSAQYADIAERFAADAVMTPGAVVMLGGAQEITETSEELSEQVFGVVSTQPAYMMNSGAGNDDSHPFVAMTGRTPVRVTGVVNKGDRIVSSSIKGTARAAQTGESINPFHVIGRALESKSDAGIGMVNCFVQAKN